MLLQEFEKRFACLSTLDWTMLDTSKVLLFMKTIDPLDQEKVGVLLETDEGLMADWAMVTGVVSRFDKPREWNDVGSSTADPIAEKRPEEIPTRSEETRRWLESGQVPANVVEGPSRGVALE